MLRLRPYNKNDAEIIMSWIKGENAFYKWTAGVLGEYPISAEHFNMVSNLIAFTAIDDNGKTIEVTLVLDDDDNVIIVTGNVTEIEDALIKTYEHKSSASSSYIVIDPSAPSLVLLHVKCFTSC